MKLLLAIAALLSASAFAQSAAVPTGGFCAIVENSIDPNRTNFLVVNNGDRIKNLNRVIMNDGSADWDNKISIVTVHRGCAMIGFQYQDFNIDYRTGQRLSGFAELFANRTAAETKTFVLDSYTNDKISSVKCFCK
jgi:hypothetical protein